MNWKEVIPFSYAESKEIKTAFEPIISHILEEVTTSDHPCLIHMLGIPGAGKTTFWKKNQNHFSNYVLISFDDVMEKLPAYHKDVSTLGLKEAFARWEIPSRIAGYELLMRALKQKKNIFLDHSGAPELHLDLIKEAAKIGYHTKAYFLKCDVDTALERVAAREQQIQRHTPRELIINRYPLVRKRAEQFKQIVDEFVEIQTDITPRTEALQKDAV